jgi:hypothetical protein
MYYEYMTTQYFVRFFFYPFKTQGRIILGHTVLLLNSVHCLTSGIKKYKSMANLFTYFDGALTQ